MPPSVQTDFLNALQAANPRRSRLHDLRHTAASLMLGHGVSALVVSTILGHSNPSITLITYAHSTTEILSHAAWVMDQIVMPTRSVCRSCAKLHPMAPAIDFRLVLQPPCMALR